MYQYVYVVIIYELYYIYLPDIFSRGIQRLAQVIYQRSYLQYIVKNISCIISLYLLDLYECLAKYLYILLDGYNNIWLQHSRSIFCFHVFWRKGNNTIALKIIYIRILTIRNTIHAYAHKRTAHCPPKKNTPKSSPHANLHPIAPWAKNVARPSARPLWLLPASSLKVTRAATKKWVSLPPKTSSKLGSLEKEGIDSDTLQDTNKSHQTGKGKSSTQKWRLVGDALKIDQFFPLKSFNLLGLSNCLFMFRFTT